LFSASRVLAPKIGPLSTLAGLRFGGMSDWAILGELEKNLISYWNGGSTNKVISYPFFGGYGVLRCWGRPFFLLSLFFLFLMFLKSILAYN
jgi:hypothetical protein